MTLPAGTKLAHYEIPEPIGKGGMGEVYRARDTKLKRDVAILEPDARGVLFSAPIVGDVNASPYDVTPTPIVSSYCCAPTKRARLPVMRS